MRDFIQLMKALSDETRLRIFNLLLERECCVCEVMQALDIFQTRASRNLGILKKTGLLKTRRHGLWVLYSINRQTTNRHARQLARLLQVHPIENQTLFDILRIDTVSLPIAIGLLWMMYPVLTKVKI